MEANFFQPSTFKLRLAGLLVFFFFPLSIVAAYCDYRLLKKADSCVPDQGALLLPLTDALSSLLRPPTAPASVGLKKSCWWKALARLVSQRKESLL